MAEEASNGGPSPELTAVKSESCWPSVVPTARFPGSLFAKCLLGKRVRLSLGLSVVEASPSVIWPSYGAICIDSSAVEAISIMSRGLCPVV
jgi:hypothetical protein